MGCWVQRHEVMAWLSGREPRGARGGTCWGDLGCRLLGRAGLSRWCSGQGTGGPRRCIHRVGLSLVGGTPRRAPCPPTGWEARRAVCSVGPSRPHPHSGLRSCTWSRGAAGVCGVGLENWPLLLAKSLCSLMLSLPRAWDPWMDGAGFKPLLLCPGTSAGSQRCPHLEGSHLRTHAPGRQWLGRFTSRRVCATLS